MRRDKSRLHLQRIKIKKIKNKYRIPSARLENWDYDANGAYFITICTHKMQHYFGEVLEREMQLNELGKLAHDLWQEITNQFSYVELGNFVIMPNHMHGILIINKSVSSSPDGSDVLVLGLDTKDIADSGPRSLGISQKKRDLLSKKKKSRLYIFLILNNT